MGNSLYDKFSENSYEPIRIYTYNYTPKCIYEILLILIIYDEENVCYHYHLYVYIYSNYIIHITTHIIIYRYKGMTGFLEKRLRTKNHTEKRENSVICSYKTPFAATKVDIYNI